jgi:transcription elongation GreA/GreB family factor
MRMHLVQRVYVRRLAAIEVTATTEQKSEQDENDDPSGSRHFNTSTLHTSNRHARRYSWLVSKAFTKEDDDAPPPPLHRRGIPVPEPNYVTRAGASAARAELEHLMQSGGDSDRIRELGDHLATAQIVDPSGDAEDPQGDVSVGFGAEVTVEDDDGKRTSYRIVGAIEADPRRGLLSWQTPLANALWGARVGDSVELPRGPAEVVAIRYPAT